MNEETCVCCGISIPEGGQVCPLCAGTADWRELYAKAAKERDEARAALRALKDERAEFWKSIEHAAVAYAKSEGRTDEGDTLHEALYGLRPSRKHENDLPTEVRRRRR